MKRLGNIRWSGEAVRTNLILAGCCRLFIGFNKMTQCLGGTLYDCFINYFVGWKRKKLRHIVRVSSKTHFLAIKNAVHVWFDGDERAWPYIEDVLQSCLVMNDSGYDRQPDVTDSKIVFSFCFYFWLFVYVRRVTNIRMVAVIMCLQQHIIHVNTLPM